MNINTISNTANMHRRNQISKFDVKIAAGIIRVGFQNGILFMMLLFLSISSHVVSQSDVDIEGTIQLEKGNGNVIIGKNAASNISSSFDSRGTFPHTMTISRQHENRSLFLERCFIRNFAALLTRLISLFRIDKESTSSSPVL